MESSATDIREYPAIEVVNYHNRMIVCRLGPMQPFTYELPPTIASNGRQYKTVTVSLGVPSKSGPLGLGFSPVLLSLTKTKIRTEIIDFR